MKVAPARFHVPDLKGKKSYRFRCNCCSAYNDREELLAKAVAKETEEEIVDPHGDYYYWDWDDEYYWAYWNKFKDRYT